VNVIAVKRQRSLFAVQAWVSRPVSRGCWLDGVSVDRKTFDRLRSGRAGGGAVLLVRELKRRGRSKVQREPNPDRACLAAHRQL